MDPLSLITQPKLDKYVPELPHSILYFFFYFFYVSYRLKSCKQHWLSLPLPLASFHFFFLSLSYFNIFFLRSTKKKKKKLYFILFEFTTFIMHFISTSSAVVKHVVCIFGLNWHQKKKKKKIQPGLRKVPTKMQQKWENKSHNTKCTPTGLFIFLSAVIFSSMYFILFNAFFLSFGPYIAHQAGFLLSSSIIPIWLLKFQFDFSIKPLSLPSAERNKDITSF